MLRKSLKLLAACGVLGAMLWVAAPALSTRPYVPAASDFSQPLPVLERLGAAQLRATAADHADHDHARAKSFAYESPPISAPARFDLVGVAGYERPVDLRVRSEGEDWSEWVTIGAGDPLYTGGSDEVQVRANRPLRKADLHYVNVSGDTTELGGVLNDIRGSINSAVIGTFGTEALAASPKPQFVSRRDWGAKSRKGGCEPRKRPDMGKVKAAVVHHTVSLNNYSESEAPGIVLGICRYHRNANGWNDIGYNALVDRFGNVYQGRAGGMAKPVIGAQAEGHNSQTAGVATIANHESTKPSGPERRGLISYLAWRLDKAGVPALGKTRLKSSGGSTTRTPAGKKIRVRRIIGHRDTNETACPGGYLYDQLGRLRRKTQKRMDEYSGVTDDPGDGGSDPGGVVPRG